MEFKWAKWARRVLLGELACFCAWLASFFAFTILFQVPWAAGVGGRGGGAQLHISRACAAVCVGALQPQGHPPRSWRPGPRYQSTALPAGPPLPLPPQDEDEGASLADLLATHRGRLTVGAELVCLASMVPFLVRGAGEGERGGGGCGQRAGRWRRWRRARLQPADSQLFRRDAACCAAPLTRPACCLPSPLQRQLLEYGTLAAYGLSGWLSVWNGLDLATYTLQARVA